MKFFPAEASGGLGMVKALSAAFPQVRFVPTGGITAASAPAYLAHPAVVAVGGSWMVAPDLLAAGSGTRSPRSAARPRRRLVRTPEPDLQGGPS